MEAKDELHSKLKKKHHYREIIVCQHSRGGGSNANLVAAGLGTEEQRQEGQPAHTGRPTHTSGPTAKLRLPAYSRSDGYYSSARRVPFRAVGLVSSVVYRIERFDIIVSISVPKTVPKSGRYSNNFR